MVLSLESATDGADPGTDGRIQGTIILTLNKTDGASETLELEVDLKILPKFKVTFEAGSETFTGTAPTQENVTEGTVIKLPENSFTVYGKNFIVWSAWGWNTVSKRLRIYNAERECHVHSKDGR